MFSRSASTPDWFRIYEAKKQSPRWSIWLAARFQSLTWQLCSKHSSKCASQQICTTVLCSAHNGKKYTTYSTITISLSLPTASREYATAQRGKVLHLTLARFCPEVKYQRRLGHYIPCRACFLRKGKKALWQVIWPYFAIGVILLRKRLSRIIRWPALTCAHRDHFFDRLTTLCIPCYPSPLHHTMPLEWCSTWLLHQLFRNAPANMLLIPSSPACPYVRGLYGTFDKRPTPLALCNAKVGDPFFCTRCRPTFRFKRCIILHSTKQYVLQTLSAVWFEPSCIHKRKSCSDCVTRQSMAYRSIYDTPQCWYFEFISHDP